MDAVSRLLEERERARPGFARWVILAIALHLTLAATVFALARLAPGRPHRLPSVAVRLVTLPAPRPAPAAGGGSPEQPAPVKAPSPKPRPTAAPAPRPKPPEKRPSEQALAAPGAHATPAPEPTPPPPGTGEGQGSGGPAGLSLGAGGGETNGIPSDFRFTYYVQRMLGLIESHWFKPPAPQGTRARVRFTIARTGQLSGIALEEPSGVPAFDRAALRALYASNPLPPLPYGYDGESLTIHLTFSETP